jgi:Zn-dependent protease with chaperone function
MFDSLARLLIVAGILLILAGALLYLGGKIPWLGHLPGDIVIRRERWTLHVPLTTCLVVSLLLTLLFSLFSRR